MKGNETRTPVTGGTRRVGRAGAGLAAAAILLTGCSGDTPSEEARAETPTSGGSVQELAGDHAVYTSVEDLWAASDVVVLGTVQGTSSRPAANGREDSVVTIQVDRTFTGGDVMSHGATVTAIAPSGVRADGATEEREGVPAFSEGDARVFFLVDTGSPHGFPLRGPSQAVYSVDDAGELTPVSTGTGEPVLDLSLEDLTALADADEG